jgi:hypothetical protein
MSPAKPKLADPGTLIRSGKLRTDTFPVCLDPDLVGEYEQLLERRDQAKEAARDSLAGGNVVELDDEIADLLEQMQAATITLVLQALPRPKFRALIDEHPPRKDDGGKLTHPEDAIGVNASTFFEALVRVSVVEPVLDEETLTLLIDERLDDRQWQDLTDAVWNLNRTSVNVPFSSAALPSRRTSSAK